MINVPAPFGTQVAMLVAGVINSHVMVCDTAQFDTGVCDGCCPQCCAPCSALRWFRDDPDGRQSLAVWFEDWDPGWDWCNPDGSINWGMIEKHWIMTECHTPLLASTGEDA